MILDVHMPATPAIPTMAATNAALDYPNAPGGANGKPRWRSPCLHSALDLPARRRSWRNHARDAGATAKARNEKAANQPVEPRPAFVPASCLNLGRTTLRYL